MSRRSRSPQRRRSKSPPNRSFNLEGLERDLPDVRDKELRKRLYSNQNMFDFIITNIAERIDEEETEELNDIFNKYRYDVRIYFNHPTILQRYDKTLPVTDPMLVDVLVYLLKNQLFNLYTLNSELKANGSKYRIILMDREKGLEDVPTDYYFDIVEIKPVKTFSIPVYEND